MAPTTAPADMQSIFKFLLSKHKPETIYPMDDIEDLATEYSTRVSTTYKRLRGIIIRHEENIRKRYRQSYATAAKRKELLSSVWLNMPSKHLPASFDEATEKFQPTSITSKKATDNTDTTRILPYMNLEDLATDHKALLIYLNARGRNHPCTFATTERMFMPTALVKDRFIPTHKMCFEKESTYGKISVFSDAEAGEFMESRKLCLGLGEGLQVLLVQVHIYTTLVKVCEAILNDIGSAQLTSDAFPVKPEPPSLVERGDLVRSFAEFGARLRYQGITGFNISRAHRLVNSIAKGIQDHAFHLREDPGYFSDTYTDAVDHDIFKVPDAHGRPHPRLQDLDHVTLLLNGIVLRSHYHLMYWQELAGQMRELEELVYKSPNGIVYKELGDLEMNQIDYTYLLLMEMKTLYLGELKEFWTSPEFRKHCVRTGQTVTVKQSILSEPLLKETFLILYSITGAYDSDTVVGWSDLYLRLDLLETYLSRKPKAREFLSHATEQILTKLSVLAECAFQLKMQPWYTESVYGLRLQAADYPDDLMNSFKGWEKVFQHDGGLITNPVLENPHNDRFLYPSDKSAARKPIRQALCKAESHLDEFWTMVDGNIMKLCEQPQRESLQRILDEGGAMRRTKTWDEKFRRANETDRPENIFQPQATSQVFHDPSADITANFDRLTVADKTKKKTRGTPDPVVEPAPQAPEIDLDEKTVYKMDPNSYHVFSALFYIPDERGNVPGKITWDEFLSALTKLGFAAEQMHGSAWELTPVGELEHLRRGVQFHQPHPSNEVPLKLARNFGRRLARAYGWDGTMFVQE